MKKITYLLGAGASAYAVPVINQFEERLQNFIFHVQSTHNTLSTSESFEIGGNERMTKRECQLQYIEDLKWLKNEISPQFTIDNFASSLNHSEDKKALRRLKGLLAGFLLFEQKNNTNDRRYQAFLSKIMKPTVSIFPENINILSWNYDMQIEIAFNNLKDHKNLDIVAEYFPIYTKNGFNKWHPEDLGKFSVVKLNGQAYDYAASHQDSRGLFLENWDVEPGKPQIEELVKGYMKYLSHYPVECGISYAWEEPVNLAQSAIIQAAKAATKDTNVLVVIGYSFPDYNKVVDKEIIGSMPVSRVYFQDLNPKAVEDSFRAIRTSNIKVIEHIEDTNAFFLPPELYI